VLNPGDDLHTETRRVLLHLRNGCLIDLPRWNHGFLDSDTDAAARLFESFFDAPDAAPYDGLVVPKWAHIEPTLV
jgi:hypothetical protein